MNDESWYLVTARFVGEDARETERSAAFFGDIDEARRYSYDLFAAFRNMGGFVCAPVRRIDGLPELKGTPERWEQLPQWADSNEVIARLQRLSEVTADHLRKARRELATLRFDLEEAEELLSQWHGKGERFRLLRTPEHYRGDGFVTCSRALESAASQEGASGLPNMAMYWWGCAFKYLWRMWSKGDPESDAAKACDCVRKAMCAWRAEK